MYVAVVAKISIAAALELAPLVGDSSFPASEIAAKGAAILVGLNHSFPSSDERGPARNGSWHPEDFNAFLFRTNIFQTTLQAPRGGRLDYNEIVVDGAHWTEHLPTTIEAFFQSSDHGRGRRNDHIAREQHLHFLLKYGLTAEQVPLLDFDPHNWETPFQLAVGG